MSEKKKVNKFIFWEKKEDQNKTGRSAAPTHHLYEEFDWESSEGLSVAPGQFILPGRLTEQRVAVLQTHSQRVRGYLSEPGTTNTCSWRWHLSLSLVTIRMGWVEPGYVPRGGVMKFGRRDGRCF